MSDLIVFDFRRSQRCSDAINKSNGIINDSASRLEKVHNRLDSWWKGDSLVGYTESFFGPNGGKRVIDENMRDVATLLWFMKRVHVRKMEWEREGKSYFE